MPIIFIMQLAPTAWFAGMATPIISTFMKTHMNITLDIRVGQVNCHSVDRAASHR